jgi:hypothetical protein
MPRLRTPHSLRRPRPHLCTVALLLAAGSFGCGSDDPVTPLPTPGAIVIIQGDEQVDRVSQELPDPLVVRVLDVSDVPVAGVSVVWAAQGGGSVSPETVATDADGIAAVRRVLGPSAGDQTTTAAVSGLPGLQVTFTTRAVAED